ncbi:MAG: germination protein YpeB, partial [Clostridia bacterium]|nr:germination protein YpeB [Clostridia bacterium]
MNNENRKQRRNKTVFIITTSILSVLALTFMVLYSTTRSSLTEVSRSLEYSYERSYYDLVDNINNAEIKMSKVLVSKDREYTTKLLREVVENTRGASENLSNLPASINGLSETTQFINKVN